MKEKLLKIAEHYGIRNQLRKFNEESYELIEAIFEYVYDEYKFENDSVLKKHIAEEIADVTVMLLQFKEYYHIDGKEILDIMNKKIDRQLERIKGESNE